MEEAKHKVEEKAEEAKEEEEPVYQVCLVFVFCDLFWLKLSRILLFPLHGFNFSKVWSKIRLLYHWFMSINSTKWQSFRPVQLKAFADNNLNVNKKLKFALGRVENIVGKGENAGYQHFLLFPHCFQKASFTEVLKVGIVW